MSSLVRVRDQQIRELQRVVPKARGGWGLGGWVGCGVEG